MSGSEKAGNGRGKKYSHRRQRDNAPGKSAAQGGGSYRNDSRKGGNHQKGAGIPEKRFQDRRPPSENVNRQNRGSRKDGENSRAEKTAFVDRPKWIPPKMNVDPLPVPDCPYCGKPIRDISSAMADRDTGAPVHFDCTAARIAGGEILEKDETVAYIGGGRFGIVNNSGGPQAAGRGSTQTGFKIRKIIEWEDKDKRADWRSVVCDHYSVT